MPEVDGFEVLRSLSPESQPAVIFVTAHDRHAVRAFEVHAVDYLLKPVTQARLQQAVRHALQQAQGQRSATFQKVSELLRSNKLGSPYLARIPVRTGNQTLFISVEQVDFVESAANYLVLRTGTGSHVLRETLSHIETRLPPELFLRISRSVIVNVTRVKALQAGPEGQNTILLQDGRQFSATRSAREIRQRLQFGQPE
jgi:two-component system LytT family response regulator